MTKSYNMYTYPGEYDGIMKGLIIIAVGIFLFILYIWGVETGVF